jgi:hypothetical protein
MLQARVEKMEPERKNVNERKQSEAHPSISVGSYEMISLMDKEDATVQQPSAQASKQSCHSIN